MRLILVRHGDAHAGLHGIIGGPKGCAGLTDLGRIQAAALRDHLAESQHLRPDLLLASELPRAIETASIIAPALGFEEATRDCDLCEVHTGEADGLDWTEWETRYGPLDMATDPDRVFAPGGESWNSFNDRVHTTMLRLAHEHAGRTVVAVCHAGVIMSSIRSIFDIPRPGTGARMQPTNTGLTDWEYEPAIDRWTLHRFNDSGHLVGLPGGG